MTPWDNTTTITALAWPSVTPAVEYRYTELDLIGRGTTSEVLVARRDGAGGFARTVVLKRLRDELADQTEIVRVFLDEARIGGQVQHGGIVPIFDLGRHRGRWYYAMERIDGPTLAEILARAQADRGRLELAAAIAIVARLCGALHHLHDRRGSDGAPLRIVHGDVSPGRVFVTAEGAVKLRISPATTAAAMTRTVVVSGTAAYSSPEQLTDAPFDRRSDVFALGILLWELTTGAPLFAGLSELDSFRAIVEAEPPRPSTVVADYPPALEAIVMRCLRRDPAERWATAAALEDALATVATAHGLRLLPATIAAVVRPPPQRAPARLRTRTPRGTAPLAVRGTAPIATTPTATLLVEQLFADELFADELLADDSGAHELVLDAPPRRAAAAVTAARSVVRRTGSGRIAGIAAAAAVAFVAIALVVAVELPAPGDDATALRAPASAPLLVLPAIAPTDPPVAELAAQAAVLPDPAIVLTAADPIVTIDAAGPPCPAPAAPATAGPNAHRPGGRRAHHHRAAPVRPAPSAAATIQVLAPSPEQLDSLPL